MKTRPGDIAALIDHTLLQPEAAPEAVERLCREAVRHGFCCVCVSPVFVRAAGEWLAQSPVKVCTVIGFPTGAHESEIKAREAALALEQGADELDVVMNIGAAKAGDWRRVESDIAGVTARAGGRIVKAILETCLLSDAEKTAACKACVAAGADFVKTSTGFSRAGATVEDVRLLRAAVGRESGVKASGGIRDYETACRMIEAGANRLGTSAGLKIIAASAAGQGKGKAPMNMGRSHGIPVDFTGSGR